jgi:putative endonuclease
MWTDMWIGMQVWAIRALDTLGRRFGRGSKAAPHLETGTRGEREALLHLRQKGYTVVARRWKNARLRGDVDLIGWEGDWLCFIEVKTRSGRGAMPAEDAVDDDKQEMLRRLARAYLQRFPSSLREGVRVRFDVVSVYLQPSGDEFDVYRGAFGW